MAKEENKNRLNIQQPFLDVLCQLTAICSSGTSSIPFKCTHVNINTFTLKSKATLSLQSLKSTFHCLGYIFTSFHSDE